MSIATELEVFNGDPFKYDWLADWCTYAGALCVVADIGRGWWRYHKGEISGRDLIRHGTKSIVRTGTMYYSSILGVLGGEVLGAGGTMAVTGTLPGAALLCTYALLGAYGANKLNNKMVEWLFEKLWPNDEEAAKKEQIKDAFQYFQYNKDEIKTFNTNGKESEKELNAKFRHFAKYHHPDRNGGSHAKFLELNVHYGILKGLLNCDTSNSGINAFVDNVMSGAR